MISPTDNKKMSEEELQEQIIQQISFSGRTRWYYVPLNKVYIHW